MTFDAAQRWYGGLTCDHLYADCPNRTRVLDGPREIEREWCWLCRYRLQRKTASKGAA